jgi:hypothetical protein
VNTQGIRSIGIVALLVAACALLVAACASGPRLRHKHEFSLTPGQEHHAGLGKVLLLPLDSTNEKRVKDLAVHNDRIDALIVRHLESKGIAIERVDPRTFPRIRDAARMKVLAERKSGAAGVVSTTLEFADLVPEILAKLGKSPDLVIAADLVERDAVYQGTRTIAWDGVRRRETVTDLSMSGGGLPAGSLRASVYTVDGTEVFRGFGGLEPIFRIDRGQEKYVAREDLFEDERNLREGICIAFYPYFGMAEYCGR